MGCRVRSSGKSLSSRHAPHAAAATREQVRPASWKPHTAVALEQPARVPAACLPPDRAHWPPQPGPHKPCHAQTHQRSRCIACNFSGSFGGNMVGRIWVCLLRGTSSQSANHCPSLVITCRPHGGHHQDATTKVGLSPAPRLEEHSAPPSGLALPAAQWRRQKGFRNQARHGDAFFSWTVFCF